MKPYHVFQFKLMLTSEHRDVDRTGSHLMTSRRKRLLPFMAAGIRRRRFSLSKRQRENVRLGCNGVGRANHVLAFGKGGRRSVDEFSTVTSASSSAPHIARTHLFRTLDFNLVIYLRTFFS